MQRVIVDGRYTYETDVDVEVGDEVLLPAGWSDEWVGKITATSSEYAGPCKRIVRIIRRRGDAERRDAQLAAIPIAGFQAGSSVETTASCGHKVVLRIQEVNRVGRPTHITYACDVCGSVPTGAHLGSADAWRWYVVGHDPDV